jgi:hypothetical protein
MVRKLNKSERLVDEQMLALLEWAADHPKRWHDIGDSVPARASEEVVKGQERGTTPRLYPVIRVLSY